MNNNNDLKSFIQLIEEVTNDAEVVTIQNHVFEYIRSQVREVIGDTIRTSDGLTFEYASSTTERDHGYNRELTLRYDNDDHTLSIILNFGTTYSYEGNDTEIHSGIETYLVDKERNDILYYITDIDVQDGEQGSFWSSERREDDPVAYFEENLTGHLADIDRFVVDTQGSLRRINIGFVVGDLDSFKN